MWNPHRSKIFQYIVDLRKEIIFGTSVGKISIHKETHPNKLGWLTSPGSEIRLSVYIRIHQATWMSPDQKSQNQIDHVVIDRDIRRFYILLSLFPLFSRGTLTVYYFNLPAIGGMIFMWSFYFWSNNNLSLSLSFKKVKKKIIIFPAL